MPQPVEVDIAVGIAGERCAFHLETMAHVEPHEFVAAVEQAVRDLLWPETAAEAVDTPPEAPGSVPVLAGEVVSDGGAAVESSRAAAPKSPRAAVPRGVSRVQARLAQRGVEVA